MTSQQINLASQLSLDGFNMEEGPSDPIEIKPEKRKMTRADKKEEKNFCDTLAYGLQSPMIFSGGGWGNDFPKDKIEMAGIQRLAQCAKCFDEKMCTLYDAMCYLNTASMENPFTHEWYKIYMHTFREAAPDMWKQLIAGDKWIEKDAELYENEVDSLNRLRSWIYKKQVDHIKSKSS